MKEIFKASVWQAKDGQEFDTAEQCELYERICADPLSFFKERYLFFENRAEDEEQPWHYCNFAIVIKPVTLAELKSVDRWRKWCSGGLSGHFTDIDLHKGDILFGEHTKEHPKNANFGWEHLRLKELDFNVRYCQERLNEAIEMRDNFKRIMKEWENYNERNL